MGDLINHPDLHIIGSEAINTGLLKEENLNENIRIKLEKLKVIIHPTTRSLWREENRSTTLIIIRVRLIRPNTDQRKGHRPKYSEVFKRYSSTPASKYIWNILSLFSRTQLEYSTIAWNV